MDQKEYITCIDRYADNIYRFILKSVKDEDKAKDIVQDSFEKLWRNLGNVNFLKVKSYLFTTAYHTMIDVIRREKKLEIFKTEHNTERSYSNSYTDLQELLHEALGRLTEAQRSVILLRDYEGYSYREIAEITSLSESQVKVYIYRARKYLKEYIGSLEAVI